MGRSIRRWSAAAIVVSLFAALAFVQSGPAQAQQVGNPGPFTLGFDSAAFRIHNLTFTVAGASISSKLTPAGLALITQGSINFPTTLVNAGTIAVTVLPTTGGSMNIDPFTGASTLSILVQFKFTDAAGTPSSTCLVGGTGASGIPISLTTGTTAPPPPNTPITGVPYNLANGTVTLVNSTMDLPLPVCASSGSTLAFLNGVGLPSASGNNEVTLTGHTTPIFTKGVDAVASVAPNPVTLGTSTSFSSAGSSATVGIASYSWNFGDGGTDTAANPSHTYAAAGNYTATLTVTDAEGTTDTDSVAVTVSSIAPNTKTVTSISGTVGIPGLNGGIATVSMNVITVNFFGIRLYVGSAAYSDPSVNKVGNSFMISTSMSRYGLNGASGRADLGFSFNGGVAFGPVSFQVDDLSAIGQGADFVRISGGGGLGYTNQGTAVSGNITVTPL